MSVNKSVTKTRSSRDYLATDYDWQGLPDIKFSTVDDPLCDPQGTTANPPLSWPSRQAAQLFAFSSPSEKLFLATHMQMKDVNAAKPQQDSKNSSNSLQRSPFLTRFQVTSNDRHLLKRNTNLRFVSWNCNSSWRKSPWRPLEQRSHLRKQQNLWAILRLPYRGPAFTAMARHFRPRWASALLRAITPSYIAITQQHKDQQEQIEAFLVHFHDLMVLTSS